MITLFGIIMISALIIGVIFHASRDKRSLYRTIPCIIGAIIGYFLTHYQHVMFVYVFLGIILVEAIMYFIDKKYKSVWKAFAGASLIILIISICMTPAVDEYHEIVIDCPVTVIDGNVTINISEIPDELKTHFNNALNIDVLELSELPNGKYLKKIIVSYRCIYKKHYMENCACTEKSICGICKRHLSFMSISFK